MTNPTTFAVSSAKRSRLAGRPRMFSLPSNSSSIPERNNDDTALETVGAVTPASRATSARERGPLACRTRNTIRSFI